MNKRTKTKSRWRFQVEEVFECGAEGVEESQCVCRDGGEDGEQLKHLQLHHIPVVLEKKHSCQV